MGGGVPQQVGQDDRLGLGADEDDALFAVMLGLVTAGPVLPNLAAAVQVHRAELADFTGPASGQALEADHIGNDRGQVGQRGVDDGVVNGRNGGGFACRAAALAEPLHGRQAVVDGSRNQFPACSPLEATADFVYHVVDVAAGEFLLGKLPLNGQQAEGTEVFGRGPAVKLGGNQQGAADIGGRQGDDAVLSVVFLGEVLIGGGQFHHGDATGWAVGVGVTTGLTANSATKRA